MILYGTSLLNRNFILPETRPCCTFFFFTSSPLTNQRVPNLTRTQVIMEDYKPLMHVCMIIVNILFSMHFKSRYVQRNVGQI